MRAPRSASISSEVGWANIVPAKATKSKLYQWSKAGGQQVLGKLCLVLLVIDVISNNWAIIDYVGDAKHLLTPMLDLNTPEAMLDQYAFPSNESPALMSKVGRFMVNTSFAHIQARGSHTFMLGTTVHPIHDSVNDICGQLVQTYPIKDPNATTVQLGNVLDSVTFIRGNALTHWFSDTNSARQATKGMNETQLRAMGYTPGRHSTDLRLTTPLVLPPPGQVTTGSVFMYRYFMKALCSGCVPLTELGLDTCVIEYTYNENAKSLEITTSKAIMGGSHELGIIIQRRGGPIAALYVRFSTLLLLFGVYAASQKTVQWMDFTQQTLPQRLLRLIAPPLYRQPCTAIGLSDICFNSDIFVVLYTLTVLLDEEISMIYSRILNRWYANSGFDLWIELRLMSMTVRWLWLNCFLLKAAKWMCHFVSMAQYTGTNTVMGWLNFSSVTWMYLSVLLLFERNAFVEFGNSVIVDLHSTTQNLDATYVLFFESWYVRALPTLAAGVIGNLAGLLALDHIVNRKLWRSLARNSLGRQLVFNSTSILSEIRGAVVDKPGYGGTCVDIKIRAWCTLRWFLASHLTSLGLPEQPHVMRALAAATYKSKSPHRGNRDSKSATEDIEESQRSTATTGPRIVTEMEDTTRTETVSSNSELHVVVQDREGHMHVINAEKREMQALAVEVKILRDTNILLG
ncbi:hypothetical protein DYB25_008669 [Aphanomyces astaci]|uniref:Uncharacterized protein n=2 Tax=Aphanomyces astaci TaxID=112090 RepID=A0A397AI23_APHAT|nr:hypothetical protein DYB25_008669 [Aphanomyces astaci]